VFVFLQTSNKIKMRYNKPEKLGISSDNIKKFVEFLEEYSYATHDVIIARGDSIIFEKYWWPFVQDDFHRMYSCSKSIVSLAIGFLEQDKIIKLDDKIINYFPNEFIDQRDENIRNLTIRNMLMMCTARKCPNWFNAKPDDRVKYYFENNGVSTHPSGMMFYYDSTGSFVLGALVERITGMTFMEYLHTKLFQKLGVSRDAYCLKCPGGHSWGDSGVLMKPMDLLLIARFVLNKGQWNGEQILNEEYVTKATSKLVDNDYIGSDPTTKGYGYQFRLTYRNSFFFSGMGSQYAICVPDKDIIMVYNGDNQGKDDSMIFNKFFELIVEPATEEALPENPVAEKLLQEYATDLKLLIAKGNVDSEFKKESNHVTYKMLENPMGIREFSLQFDGNNGTFAYVNEQGKKKISFGMGYNEIGLFPQEGYSDEVGTIKTTGHYYRCAASASWVEPQKIRILVQIIDKYFGNLSITISFQENKAMIHMVKAAEDFLNEYDGDAYGFKK